MNESVFQQLTERNVLRTGNCITGRYFNTDKFFVLWMRRHLSIHCSNLANQAIPINSGLSMSHCTRKVSASHPICCLYWALLFSQLFQVQWHGVQRRIQSLLSCCMDLYPNRPVTVVMDFFFVRNFCRTIFFLFFDRASCYEFLLITNLTHFFYVFIYFISLHVSSITVLIIRRWMY